ncbi:MAG: hypothetical protein WC855_02370 [Thermodesulfovibrionales bacterium]
MELKKREKSRQRNSIIKSLVFICTLALVFCVASNNAIGVTVNITPSLPSGCSECGVAPAIPNPTVNETQNANCGSAWGVTLPTYNNTYTLTTPCFDSNTEKWLSFLQTLTTEVGIIRRCPSHPPNVACLGDVAGMTKAQAQAVLAVYPADPITLSDVQSAGQKNWACDECTARHEEAHLNIDWLQNAFGPELTRFSTYLKNNGVAVNCSTASTLSCNTAITAAVKTQYDTEWQNRLRAAVVTWNSNGEGSSGYNAEIPCYQVIRNTLVQRANQP